MIRKISGTVAYKVLNALLNFIIVVLSSNYLGAEGKGITSIFIANVTVVLLISNLNGGTALIYLSPKRNRFQLLVSSYAWTVIISSLSCLLLQVTGFSQEGMLSDMLLVCILQGLYSVNTFIAIGNEKIHQANFLSLLQVLIFAGLLFLFFVLWQDPSIPLFLGGIKISFFTVFLLSFIPIRNVFSSVTFADFKTTARQLLSYGITGQTSNIVQFLNYRLNYYFLFLIAGEKEVGIFSVTVALAESVWIIGRSIGLVQYARISNSNDKAYAKTLTFKLVRLSFAGTTTLMLFLALLPESFFSEIFGRDFTGSKYPILALSPGIIALGTSTVFSHYFAGFGKYNINNISATIGLVVVLSSGYLLTATMGTIGAGFSMSFSYICSSCYFLYRFNKETGFSFRDIIPLKQDFQSLLNIFYLKTDK